jgi:hypothetical protein
VTIGRQAALGGELEAIDGNESGGAGRVGRWMRRADRGVVFQVIRASRPKRGSPRLRSVSMGDARDLPLRWTAWPLRERPAAAAGLLMAVVALGALAGTIGGDLFWGLLAAFLVLVWLTGFLLPTRFEADTIRVVASGPLFTRRLAWCEVTRLAVQSSGGWIGRAAGPRWRRRGLDLLWPAASGTPDRLMAMVRAHHAAIDVRDLRGAGVSPAGKSQGGASITEPRPIARTSEDPTP